MKRWKKKISEIYGSLPQKLKTYKEQIMFRSIALDPVLLIDIEQGQEEAVRVKNMIDLLEGQLTLDNHEKVKAALDAYYLKRRDSGRWECYAFDLALRDVPMPPIFVLSYNRWDKNATLARMEMWNDEEVFENTFVFVQPDQKAKYEKYHPKFYFYERNANSVGERMIKVLEFCREWGIKEAIITEDDIASFNFVKKGGTEGNGRLSSIPEDCGGAFMKYFAQQGHSLFKKYDDLVIVGMRNRVMANNETTSIIGHHDPMRGGCPNMIYYVNVERFYPIYKSIPEEHYSPQYDWAIQCAIVKAKKRWAIVTGIVKDENCSSSSVIGYSGDREELAKQYIEYYGVGDVMTYRKFKDTALQGVKIFYNKRIKDNYEKLF